LTTSVIEMEDGKRATDSLCCGCCSTAERTHTVSLPPIIGGGACVLIFGVWSKKD
jgi:hypothetical protein